MAAPTIKLNSGYDIPIVAYGTWQVSEEDVTRTVSYAITEAGYRHIDCAWGYMNEKGVGEGIKKSGIKREELFITSKLWGTWHSRVEEALDQTLTALGTDYLDLYLMHWPIPLNPNGNDGFIPKRPDGSRDIDANWDIKDTWKQMEALVKKGKIRSIGVSNFSIPTLSSFLPHVSTIPATNQLELHVYNPDLALVAYCKEKGIVPQAYSPLGSNGSPLIKDEDVQKIAGEKGISGAEVLLGWLVAKDIVVVTRSLNEGRIRQNIEGSVKASKLLTKEDIALLDGLAAAGKQKRMVMPPWGVDLGFDNWTNKSW
ncbi:Aldo/keto reductase [Stereum hirsutum FP-91666 SS1]|uniref:Aldo/keto reductase n=1 Tax=Stereum hirsutum (strain FP-91666) TaxID=721885 RepID=UPI000440CA19|nr:Aldo/keto reductase [Stereum hirsutum FP-91666 SS1]EIM89270.1 Aldo/keto reductase [Stereum hirsutum FP-91666 SS1]